MSEKKNVPQKQEPEETVKELGQEVLSQVTGGGNPFSDVPRVPEQPIDPELRGDA